VLTVDPSNRFPRYEKAGLDGIPNSVRVFRTYPGPFHHLQRLSYADRTTKTERPNLQRALKDNNAKVARGIYRLLVRPLLVPDRMVEWVPFGLLAASKLASTNQYRLIVSSSSPQTSHIVGYFLKQRTGLPWIGDWSDPLAFNPNYVLSRWQRSAFRRLEHRLTEAMDHIIVSTDETKEAYLRNYPSLPADKISVVSYGYSPQQFEGTIPAIPSKFRIVYTGIFLKTIRRPYAFFDGLAQLKELPIEILVAGTMEPEFIEYAQKLGIGNMLHFLGHVPHNEVLALQKGASVLLLLGNVGGLQLPGKVFEYIAAQRPILSIKNDAHDIAANVVQRYNRGSVCSNDADSIADAIRRLYDLYQAGHLDARFDLRVLHEFSWPGLAQNVDNIISNLLDRPVN
jgi:glycosyltransferase involved in cell wall biosynthesis